MTSEDFEYCAQVTWASSMVPLECFFIAYQPLVTSDWRNKAFWNYESAEPVALQNDSDLLFDLLVKTEDSAQTW